MTSPRSWPAAAPRAMDNPIRAGQGQRLGRRPAGAAVLRRAAALARPAADLRRRRGDDHRPRRSGARAHRQSGLHPQHRSPHGVALPGPARSHDVGVDQDRRRPTRASATARSTSPSSWSTTATKRSSCARRSGLVDHANVNPSGGPLARPSGDGDRPHPRDRGRAAHQGRRRQSRRRPRVERRVPSAKSGLRVGREQLMAVPCAVIGIGQTKYKSRRPDVSLEGLVREAVLRALEDAELTFKDIDAIVIGKAPDALEGVMMPELSLADAHRCGRQADPPRAHRGLGGRVDRRLGRDPGRIRALRTGSGGLLREAVRRQRHVGALGWAVGRAGCGRHVRSVDPQLHPAVQGTRAHRLDGGGQGPPERAQEPLRAPAPQGHLDREGEGVPDAVGPAALPRVVPVVRRRGGGRARRRSRGQEGTRVRPRGSSPTRSAPSSASSPDATRSSRRPASTARESSTRRPASPTRSSRSTAPSCTCRSRGTSRCGSKATSSSRKARVGR